MSIFRKIGKSIGSAFKKAPDAISSVFRKAGNVATDVAGGLGKVSSVLGKVADVGSQVLNNPLTQLAGSALLGPEFAMGAQQAGNILGQVKRGSEIAGRASNIASRAGQLSTDASRYRTPQDAMRGIERAKDIARDAGGVAGPAFA